MPWGLPLEQALLFGSPELLCLKLSQIRPVHVVLLNPLQDAIWRIAGSWHRRSHPCHEGENLTCKVDQVFRDSEKLPPVLTLKMISVFLMLASINYSLISVTQAEGLPGSLSK